MNKTLCVGEVVTTIADWDAIGVLRNERGIVFEVYEIGRGHWGAQIIFEGGGYCGFSHEEIEQWIRSTGEVVLELTNYQFKNVVKTSEDFRRGSFNQALKR